MKLHYTQKNEALPGFSARNPRRFERAESGAQEVVVDGDYPHIVAAYKKAGAVVNAAQEKEPEKTQDNEGSGGDLKALKVPELKALAEERGIEFASNATKAQLIELLTAEQDAEE